MDHTEKKPKRMPRWKWVVVILLMIAMPLFFSFVRTLQLQQAISEMPPIPQEKTTTPQHS